MFTEWPQILPRSHLHWGMWRSLIQHTVNSFICFVFLLWYLKQLLSLLQWGEQPDSSTPLSRLPFQDVRSTGFPLLPGAVWDQARWLLGKTHLQIKLRWALFVTYTIIQSIMRSEMCSLHLTHPSGAVGSRHCGARGAVGGSVPCPRVSPQLWTLTARAGKALAEVPRLS